MKSFLAWARRNALSGSAIAMGLAVGYALSR